MFAYTLKSDETCEKVAIPAARAFFDQRNLVLQMMVLRLKVFLMRGDGSTMSFQLAIAPKLVLSVSAANLWYAINYSKDMAAIWECVLKFESLASERLVPCEAHGASANKRLIAHTRSNMAEKDPQKMFVSGMCHLLANKLVEASLVSAVRIKLLSRFYSFSLFLKTSWYFHRVIMALPVVVDTLIEIRPTLPPREITEHAQE